MTSSRKNGPEQQEDSFESLFKDIEARPQPPAEVEQDVYQYLQQQWVKQRADKRRRKNIYYMALAASVLFVILLQPVFKLSKDLPGGPSYLATVEILAGAVSVHESGRNFELETEMLPLQMLTGQSISSGTDSGVSIKWGPDGASVRVDQNSILKLISSTQIELVSGQVYLDIPRGVAVGSNSANELQILTRFGTIRHTGTQFTVALADQKLEVKVREGIVAIDSGSQSHMAPVGVKGILDSAGNFRSEPIATYGPSWSWVEKLALAYEIEGRSVVEFLDWVQRETGRSYDFDSTKAEIHARETLMHGSNLVMEPMRALDVVLQTTGLSWEERNGKLMISLKR